MTLTKLFSLSEVPVSQFEDGTTDPLNSVQESSEPGMAAPQQRLLWLSPHSSLHRVYGGV